MAGLQRLDSVVNDFTKEFPTDNNNSEDINKGCSKQQTFLLENGLCEN